MTVDGVDGAGKTTFADELRDALNDADVVVNAPEERAVPGAILLLDGIFLHRPALRRY